MRYEVVERSTGRGVGGVHTDLAEATASLDAALYDVYELDTQNGYARGKRVWPADDPATDDLAEKRATRSTAEYVGRAEREATALLAEITVDTGERLHAVVTVAWLKGFMVGYGDVVERLDEITARYEKGARS